MLIIAVCLALLPGPSRAKDEAPVEAKTTNKNITIVEGTASADGKSDVREQVLEECIVSLPRVEELEANVNAQSQYLREINNDPAKSAHVKTYTATIDINYMQYQKVLYIITTNSVPAHDPVMKMVEKNIKQSRQIVSDPANGDMSAKNPKLEYFFSTPEAAIKDAKAKAAVWIRQQSAVVCGPKSIRESKENQ
jgi:hypothetical protein